MRETESRESVAFERSGSKRRETGSFDRLWCGIAVLGIFAHCSDGLNPEETA